MESIPRHVVTSPKRFCNIFAISRLLGLMPVTSELIISKKWFFVSMFLYLPFPFLHAFYKYLTNDNLPAKFTAIHRFIILISGSYNILPAILYSLSLIIKRNVFNNILLKIRLLEDYKHKAISVLLVWCTFIILYLSFRTVMMYVFNSKLFPKPIGIVTIFIFHTLPYIRSIMMILLYCYITQSVADAVKQMKKTLSPSIHQLTFKFEKFLDAMELIKLNNEFFSYQILMFVFQCLVTTTFHTYNIINSFRTDFKTFGVEPTLLELADMFGSIQLLILYFITVSNTQNKVSGFSNSDIFICYEIGETIKCSLSFEYPRHLKGIFQASLTHNQ